MTRKELVICTIAATIAVITFEYVTQKLRVHQLVKASAQVAD